MLTLYIFGAIPVFIALFVYLTTHLLNEEVTIGTFLCMSLIACIPICREGVLLIILFLSKRNYLDTVIFKAKK